VSKDPIGEMGGLNVYGYAGNHPISRVDRLGLIDIDILLVPPDEEGVDKAGKTSSLWKAKLKSNFLWNKCLKTDRNTEEMISAILEKLGPDGKIDNLNIYSHNGNVGLYFGNMFINAPFTQEQMDLIAKLKGRFSPGASITFTQCSADKVTPTVENITERSRLLKRFADYFGVTTSAPSTYVDPVLGPNGDGTWLVETP
jgi:hypothetical protein